MCIYRTGVKFLMSFFLVDCSPIRYC